MSPLRFSLISVVAALALAGAAQAQTPDFGRLHSALKLTPAQEDGWRAFVASNQPDPEQQARDRGAQAMLPSLTAPQRLQLEIDAMRADVRTLELREASLKTFYASLTPAQQATFDRATRPQPQEEP